MGLEEAAESGQLSEWLGELALAEALQEAEMMDNDVDTDLLLAATMDIASANTVEPSLGRDGSEWPLGLERCSSPETPIATAPIRAATVPTEDIGNLSPVRSVADATLDD